MKITTFKGDQSVIKKIGFLARSATKKGRQVLARRRSKGRHVLARSLSHHKRKV